MTSGKIAAQYVFLYLFYITKFLTATCLYLDAGELLLEIRSCFWCLLYKNLRHVNRHATLACYKALVKANPKVSSCLPSLNPTDLIYYIITFIACTTLGKDGVCFDISSWSYSASNIKMQTSKDCTKSQL